MRIGNTEQTQNRHTTTGSPGFKKWCVVEADNEVAVVYKLGIVFPRLGVSNYYQSFHCKPVFAQAIGIGRYLASIGQIFLLGSKV